MSEAKIMPQGYLFTTRKRLLDIVVGLLGVLVLLVALPFVVPLIVLTSGGAPFYIGGRVGLNGRHFRAVKFRTMYVGADRDPKRITTPDDDRITPVGRFLRAVYIDELPQFLSILKGDMSTVGPRPDTVAIFEEYCRHDPNFRLRLTVKPGLTGLSQTILPHDHDLETGIRRLKYDLAYIENATFGTDLRIIARTILRIFKRGGH